VSEQHLDVLAQPTRLAPRTSRWRVRSNSELGLRLSYVSPPSCVDGSELARAFFPRAALVGAAMCSAF
jgi:hypothetical protein